MKRSVLTRLSLKSMASRKNIYFPYLLAIGFLFALEYILLSLLSNQYVNHSDDVLSQLIMIGVFFTTLLNIIIAFYASRFISQAKQKEFGLYTVLGLENKHIRYMMRIEYLISWLATGTLSIVAGFSLGKMLFIALNRMMHDRGATLMDYPFDPFAAGVTLALLLFIFVVIFITDSFRLSRLTPADLLSKAEAGESEPKGRIVVALLGIVTLAGGYYIALTSEGVVQSLMKVFVAILLVIIGTYCLFLSGSVLVLKGMKKKKSYYYKPNHFLNVSGMLYRMKANAVSLATIAILCGGIILVMSATLTLYRGMQQKVASVMPRDYSIEMTTPSSLDVKKDEHQLQQALRSIKKETKLDHTFVLHQLVAPAELTQQKELKSLSSNPQKVKGRPVYVLAQPLQDYNRLTNTRHKLKAGQMLIDSNLIKLDDYHQLKAGEQTYDVKKVDASALTSKYGVEVICLVVKDQKQLTQLQKIFHVYDPKNKTIKTVPFDQTAYFDVAKSTPELTKKTIRSVQSKLGVIIETKKNVQRSMYSLYGGLLFIGVIVSLVLLIGTILMLYFKQIAEGYSDQHNYAIMKRVGLPDSLIRKTIRAQIIWIFGLPLAIGLIHILFATNIMSQLMGLVGITDMSLYSNSYVIVALVFAALYFGVYLLTSSAYYRLVNGEE